MQDFLHSPYELSKLSHPDPIYGLSESVGTSWRSIVCLRMPVHGYLVSLALAREYILGTRPIYLQVASEAPNFLRPRDSRFAE